MRKGDSHLELLIYLASFLQRQSPGGVPCRGRHRAPWPAVLPRFWPWQRSPLCCLTRNSPGYYQVCDLSMCGSLTRASATLSLGRSWNTPVYPLIVCPSVGREGGREGVDPWIGGSMATKKPDLGTVWRPREKKKEEPAARWAGQKAVIRFRNVSVSGAGTPSAFDVTTTAFTFVSLTHCQFSSSEAQQTGFLSLSKGWYIFIFFFFFLTHTETSQNQSESPPVPLKQSDTHSLYHYVLKCQEWGTESPGEVPRHTQEGFRKRNVS